VIDPDRQEAAVRALVQHAFGEPAAELRLETVPDPVPGPGQVLVRMSAAPIHNHDLLTVSGDYGFKPELPAPSGTEATGVVEALGDAVTGLKIGQRVAGGSFGVWAEKYVANAAALVPVPDTLDDETAAQLVSMPVSALALLNSLNANQGDWIAQNAAGGAVGRLVAQFARGRAVNVLGLVRRSAGVDELAAAGIGNIVATDTEDWRDRVAEITGGAPIIAGIDSVGGPATGDMLGLVADGGRLILFGGMASWRMEAAISDVVFRGVTIEGFWGAKVMPAMAPEERAALIGEVIQRAVVGDITLPVEEVFPLERIADAVAAHNRPGRTGKVLLRG
jgi:NADPH:quinone reductase-like Zn-dependent oxidoreductase